ncbi:MAG: hypothetical protein KF696_13090 [Planctomycetes bacterium]|nr:hypothetical protein [Planctomycetota bacterium]MCW8135492.1 hypothetical protein [Planctomycetota bacterium]
MPKHTTTTVLRSAMMIASPEGQDEARVQIADAVQLKVRAVTGLRLALAQIPHLRPHAVLVEHGALSCGGLRAVRELSELTARRSVPVVVFGAERQWSVEEQRECGVHSVVVGRRLRDMVDTLQSALERADAPLAATGA